jgi:AcrR family transcriptional regulator
MAPIAGGATEQQHPLEQRIVDAALRCIARWGVAKTTLDDVARDAGCSRASVYRAFPGGKDALLTAVVDAELSRFAAGLEAALAGVDDLEDLLVAGITYASRFAAGHDGLNFLLAHEPEVVLPRISFARMHEVLAVAADLVAPWLTPFVGSAEAPRVAEWVTRIVFSYTACPSDWVDGRDEESVRELVRDFVLPGLRQTQGETHVVH